MVKLFPELPKTSVANPDGSLKLTHNSLAAFEGVNPKIRLFSVAEVEPGCEVPFHTHIGETETYHFLSGIGIYNDNGTELPIQIGMTTFCPSGEGHGVKNTGTELLRFLAIIVVD